MTKCKDGSGGVWNDEIEKLKKKSEIKTPRKKMWRKTERLKRCEGKKKAKTHMHSHKENGNRGRKKKMGMIPSTQEVEIAR